MVKRKKDAKKALLWLVVAIYIFSGLIQFFFAFDFFYLEGLSRVSSFMISILTCYIPFVGTGVAIAGAIEKGYSWDMIALYFGPMILVILFICTVFLVGYKKGFMGKANL